MIGREYSIVLMYNWIIYKEKKIDNRENHTGIEDTSASVFGVINDGIGALTI